MKKKMVNSIAVFLFELVVFLTVFITCFVVSTSNIGPFHRGFFCNDQTLMYPHKNETITSTEVISITVFILPVVASIVEPLLYITTCMTSTGTGTRAVVKTVGKSLYSVVMMYLLGGGLTQLLVTVMKLTVGRLRPNFFAWCVPDYNITECFVGSGYIADYVCTNPDTDVAIDVKQSFPSRHSSSAAYAFLYVAIYLDIRLRKQMKWKAYFRVIAPTLQILFVIVGIYICASRIQDNEHHPTDVLVGVIIGVVTCLVTCLVWSGDSLTLLKTNTHTTDTPQNDGPTTPPGGNNLLRLISYRSSPSRNGDVNLVKSPIITSG